MSRSFLVCRRCYDNIGTFLFYLQSLLCFSCHGSFCLQALLCYSCHGSFCFRRCYDILITVLSCLRRCYDILVTVLDKLYKNHAVMEHTGKKKCRTHLTLFTFPLTCFKMRQYSFNHLFRFTFTHSSHYIRLDINSVVFLIRYTCYYS